MVEKLLTNWMSICLYTFVRVREAEVDGTVLRGGAGRGSAAHTAPSTHPFTACLLPSSMCSVTSSCPHLHLVRGGAGCPVPLCPMPLTCPRALTNSLLVPQDAVGEPLYMLFRGIKHQVDKGPVDSVTGKAKYTLNDNRLLREDVEYRPLVREGACVRTCVGR